ncbi:hypothetical protein T484DRAFT_3468721 [Baffinella frigidus]|nr:hypothetical protein T484DRAFT_3468721 [Cryptophyta sp. CCMP2293]
MKVSCDAFFEVGLSTTRRPHLLQRATVAIGRDESRSVILVVSAKESNTPLECKVDSMVAMDTRRLNEGSVAIRFASPPVSLQLFNARALLLEDLVRMLAKLASGRRLGVAVQFSSSPTAVLASLSHTVYSRQPNEVSINSVSTMHSLGKEPRPIRHQGDNGAGEDGDAARPHHSGAVGHPLSREERGTGAEDGGALAVVQERSNRLEQEVGYLSGQIQMELKAKASLKQSTAEAIARAAEACEREEAAEARAAALEDALADETDALDSEAGLRTRAEAQVDGVLAALQTVQARAAGALGARGRRARAMELLARWRTRGREAAARAARARRANAAFRNATVGAALRAWRRAARRGYALARALPRVLLARRRGALLSFLRRWTEAAGRERGRREEATRLETSERLVVALQTAAANRQLADEASAGGAAVAAAREEDRVSSADREAQLEAALREATRALAELRAEAATEGDSRARELERARARESKALQAAEEARQREGEAQEEGREQARELRERVATSEAAYDRLAKQLNQVIPLLRPPFSA